jgi:hypothetical protein
MLAVGEVLDERRSVIAIRAGGEIISGKPIVVNINRVFEKAPSSRDEMLVR